MIRQNGIGECFLFRSAINTVNGQDKGDWDRGMLPFQVSVVRYSE